MRKNTQEKSLIQISKNSIFYKIKFFLKNLFHKKSENNVSIEESIISGISSKNKKSAFIENLRNVDDTETALLKLQRKFRNGEVKEEELSDEQIDSLCTLYDKQIANLKKLNEIKRQKLLEYKKDLQTNTTKQME